MTIHKFETLYPRSIWVVNCSETDPEFLLKRFTFYVNTEGWNKINKNMEDEFASSCTTAIAGCYVVEEKSTRNVGILLVIYDIDSVDTSVIAHESVHLADYIYEATGCNSEDFSDGNEAYAYLVGWAAGCIANVLIKEKDGKTK